MGQISFRTVTDLAKHDSLYKMKAKHFDECQML